MSLNLMTYDYHTGSGIAHFNAPLYPAPADPTPTLNIDSTIRAYLSLGSPPEKLVLGIPFFGYKYGDVARRNDLGVKRRHWRPAPNHRVVAQQGGAVNLQGKRLGCETNRMFGHC